MRLRHKLIPYLYSMNVKAARHNEPLVQPIYWHYPNREEAYRIPNEFFFGSELVVIPMTSPRDRVTRRARTRGWLPPGRFVDLFSGIVYDGDCEKWFYRTLEDYAVLAPEGSIIPLDGAKEPGNGGNNPKAFEVKVVVGADRIFDICEDDGKGSGVEDVKWAVTRITFDQKSGTLSIDPPSSAGHFLPADRAWRVTFPALDYPENVRVLVRGADFKAEIQKRKNAVVVDLGAVSAESSIIIELGEDPQLAATNAAEHVFRVVDDAQMAFETKKKIWAAVTSEAPLGVKISQLSALDLDERLLGAILEFLTADSRAGLAKKLYGGS